VRLLFPFTASYFPLLTFLAKIVISMTIHEIQEIKIYFDYDNWDYRLDTAKAGKEDYILAKSCLINGVLFDSVGVKYKG
jgi:hypothetical protein